MADLQKDLLGLQYSANFDIKGMQEADIDLVLSTVENTSTTVYGKVTDGTAPITDATVKVFDKNGVPFQHTITDKNGEYSIDGLPVGTYSAGAVKSGYIMSATKGVTLSDSDTAELNFALIANASQALGTIAGILTIGVHAGKTVPLKGAKISLIDSTDKTIAVTYSAEDGEFAFYDVAVGSYTLLSSANGYLPAAPMVINIAQGSIVNVDLGMDTDSRTHNGTASGTIKDSKGNAVAGCFVGLYQVVVKGEGVEKETLIATTKTNGAGHYLFGDVSGGKYIVKAKMNL